MPPAAPRLWPRGKDELLIQAVLSDGDLGINAWREWSAGTNLHELDYTQQRLLPLLRENLRRLGMSSVDLDGYRGVLHKFWAHNQILYRYAAREVAMLNELGVRTLFMKGVPLSQRYYKNPALRPMSDIDLLVDESNVALACAHFIDQGWECVDDYIQSLDALEDLIEVRHGFNLRGPQGQEIDLHWNAFQTTFADPAPLWADSVAFEVDDIQAKTLSSTDHLLQACAQAAVWNVVRPIRWMPDAKMILQYGGVDWHRLLDHAQHFDLVEPVHDALLVLRDFLRLDVPNEVIEQLKRVPVKISSRLDYRMSAGPPIPLVGRVIQRYVRYLRTAKHRGLGFGEYLKKLWGVPSLSRAIWMGFRHVWRVTVTALRD